MESDWTHDYSRTTTPAATCSKDLGTRSKKLPFGGSWDARGQKPSDTKVPKMRVIGRFD